MKPRPISLVVVLAVVLAGCGWESSEESTTTAATTTEATTTEATTTSTTTTTSATTAEPETTTTTGATSEATTTTGGSAGEDLPAEFVELIEMVEDVRGLEFLATPPLSVVSDEELARRIREDFEEDVTPEDLVIDQAFFELIGLLDGSIDLAQAYQDLLAEQVAGFYDPDTGEMVIGGEGFSPMTKFILFHELVHALTDQHFGFGDDFDLLIEEERYHEAAALQALIEGDATYFQLIYFQQLPSAEQLELIEATLAIETPVTDSLPEWFADDLGFPYDTGFRFVERIVRDSGIVGVDQVYRLVPTTTEQVIHPDAYLSFEPGLAVDMPQIELEGYDVYEAGTLGEWNVDLMLLDGAPDGDAVVASTGWGGDEYQILWNGEDVAFVFVYVGDTPGDAAELQASVVEGLSENMAVGAPRVDETAGTTEMTGSTYAFVGLSGNRLVIVAASDVETGTLAAGQAFPTDG